ncbi:MAG: alpha/beta hydrolase, partial [Steroidobacteraceae bacterium]
MLTSILVFSSLALAIFLAMCALLYFGQESFIFYPRPNDAVLIEQWRPHRVEITSGGTTLEGWWVENPEATTSAVIIYFGGNAEDVLYTAATARQLDARAVLVVNYRGYGGTRGKPSQAALFEDALAIHAHVLAKGVPARDIVVMGRSLGSGVAAMLASERPVGAAILITPYDSLAAVAAHHYSFFPVRLLLKHPFPSADFAKRTKVPALILAAEHDNVVPAVHAQRLHEAWSGSETHVLEGMGHNDIEMHPRYYELINE